MAAASPDQDFERAVMLYRQHELSLADEACAALLAANPRHPPALHLRGLMALERGELAAGMELISRSLALDPRQPLAQAQLGNAYLSAGRPAEAIECLEAALRLRPDLWLAWFNRGNALRAVGRTADALVSYDAALTLRGDHAPTHCNRGLALIDLDRADDGLAAFDRAVAADPDFVLAYRNRAALLLRLERAEEALAAASAAVRLAPGDPHAATLHGDALAALGRLTEAIDSYTRALRCDPAPVEALINRSAALQRAGQLAESLADCEAALRLVPGSAMALRNTGNVLVALGRHEEALQRFEAALQHAPLDEEARCGRAAALGNVFHERMSRCDWHDHAMFTAGAHAALAATATVVNPLSLLLFDDPPLSLQCARQLAAQRYPADPALGPVRASGPGSASGRIRIAYVSADFCEHPVSHLLVGVLEQHDRRRFEVIGVSLRARRPGAFEDRVCASFDRLVDAHELADRDVAALLRSSGVDIAIDLMGFTDGMRPGIFAHRAAPLQVNYLGYAGTLGAPYIDYLLADAVTIPAGEERWYAEQVVRLPGCYLPNDDRRPVGSAPPRTAAGLPAGGFVFCAFTQPHKISPPVFGGWMQLLLAVDGSILWLRDMGPVVNANLAQHARGLGVDPQRLVFAPRVAGMAEHLARLSLADLYLDTLPYNAHSTVCDALWCGVPVITCPGRGFAARVAASALTALGLPELIVRDPDEYHRLAIHLATRPADMQSLRTRLRALRSAAPLFSSATQARHLESAYATMHARALGGEVPAAFAVEPVVPA